MFQYAAKISLLNNSVAMTTQINKYGQFECGTSFICTRDIVRWSGLVNNVVSSQRRFSSMRFCNRHSAGLPYLFPARTPCQDPQSEHDFEVGGFSKRHRINVEEKSTWTAKDRSYACKCRGSKAAIWEEIQQITPAMTVH